MALRKRRSREPKQRWEKNGPSAGGQAGAVTASDAWGAPGIRQRPTKLSRRDWFQRCGTMTDATGCLQARKKMAPVRGPFSVSRLFR